MFHNTACNDAGCDVYNLWPAEVVPGEELVGRAGVIADICRELTGGRSVLLAAPRREGKSSVAREVLRQLAEDDLYLTASLDFFRLTSKRQCADELVRQLLEGSKTLSSRLRRLVGAAGERISTFEPHLKLAEIEFGFRFNPRDVDDEEAFRNALQLPEKLAQKEDRRVVILMDEFQEAGKNLGRDVYRVMRSYFQEQPRTKHLFAGSHQSLLRALFASASAPLLRYAVEVPLPPVPAEAWVDYITRKFASIEVACSRVIAGELVRATGGHPADTMALCAQLTSLLRADSAGEITAELLAAALARTRVALRLMFDEIWSELGETAHARLLAQRIAFGVPLSTGLRGPQAERALAVMADKGLIEREGRRWRFRQPLFRDYVEDLSRRRPLAN
jgi:DNA-binding transcriptional ArsR family regulator